MIQRRRIVLGLCAAMFAVASGRGDGKTADAAPEDSRSLAGQLLIAAPGMRDPRFRETVIVMLRHDTTGALGVVINRPVGEQPLAKLLEAAGESTDGVNGNIMVHAGGPVQPGIGMVVHGSDYQVDGTLAVTTHVAMTKTTEVLRDLGQGKGPKRFLFVLGYAGWGQGQLEGELTRGFWFTTPGEPGLIFDADRDGLWERTTARRPRSL